jgi:hypothetical protein
LREVQRQLNGSRSFVEILRLTRRSGVREIGLECPHFTGTAPKLQRPMIRFAGGMNRIHVVAGFNLPLAIDLVRMRIDEAKAVRNHFSFPSRVRSDSTHCFQIVPTAVALLP